MAEITRSAKGISCKHRTWFWFQNPYTKCQAQQKTFTVPGLRWQRQIPGPHWPVNLTYLETSRPMRDSISKKKKNTQEWHLRWFAGIYVPAQTHTSTDLCTCTHKYTHNGRKGGGRKLRQWWQPVLLPGSTELSADAHIQDSRMASQAGLPVKPTLVSKTLRYPIICTPIFHTHLITSTPTSESSLT